MDRTVFVGVLIWLGVFVGIGTLWITIRTLLDNKRRAASSAISPKLVAPDPRERGCEDCDGDAYLLERLGPRVDLTIRTDGPEGVHHIRGWEVNLPGFPEFSLALHTKHGYECGTGAPALDTGGPWVITERTTGMAINRRGWPEACACEALLEAETVLGSMHRKYGMTRIQEIRQEFADDYTYNVTTA